MRMFEDFPETHPNLRAMWQVGEAILTVVTHSFGHFCGYVHLPYRPFQEVGYHGLLTYVPVHGGITFAEQQPDGSMVYGFDCMHAGDDEPGSPWHDIDRVKAEAERLLTALYAAVCYEIDYLEAKEGTGRVAIVDAYINDLATTAGIQFDLRDNMGAMISVLCGSY